MTASKHTLQTDTVRGTARRRAIVAVVVLLAFLVQSFVAQTHIHFSPAGSAAGPTLGTHAADGAAKDADGNNTSQCPWCHAVLAGGSLLTPTAVPLHLPVAWEHATPARTAAVVPAPAPAPAWQSRAPPA